MTRLVDLDPRWLCRDGRRVGLIFRTPQAQRPQSGRWYQTCFFERTSFAAQREAVWAAADDLKREGQQHFGDWQSCNEAMAWEIAGDLAAAAFETLTITPSIDGSRGGLWHGFITDGEAR